MGEKTNRGVLACISQIKLISRRIAVPPQPMKAPGQTDCCPPFPLRNPNSTNPQIHPIIGMNPISIHQADLFRSLLVDIWLGTRLMLIWENNSRLADHGNPSEAMA